MYAMSFQPALLEKIKRYQEGIMDQDVNQLTGEELHSQKDDKGVVRVSS